MRTKGAAVVGGLGKKEEAYRQGLQLPGLLLCGRGMIGQDLREEGRRHQAGLHTGWASAGDLRDLLGR